MTVEIKGEMKSCLKPLFSGWEETMINSCLQGYMGRAFANAEQMPESGMLCVGDFYFLSGTPNEDLVRTIRKIAGETALVIPREKEWESLICEILPEAEETLRYALKKNRNSFCIEKLEKLVKDLPDGFYIQLIDEELYQRCLMQEWSRDFVSLFRNAKQYKECGIGFVVMHGDDLAAGASSYSYYDGGIEIEIDTKLEYRRRGLASACAARLILECLDRGLFPSWDAANRISLALAEKLGYQFDQAYVTYVWEQNRIEENSKS